MKIKNILKVSYRESEHATPGIAFCTCLETMVPNHLTHAGLPTLSPLPAWPAPVFLSCPHLLDNQCI